MKLIKLPKSLTGPTFHQMQTAFRLDASGQVIVMTLTNAAPLNDEQRALAVRMLESFQPRPVAPALNVAANGKSPFVAKNGC
ncbi:hypothetical protein [Burkholderia ambifaria]